MIHYVSGDILQAETDAVVNTVNCVGVMGKGLALQFKYKYPLMYCTYKEACQHGKVKVGEIFVWSVPLVDRRLVKPRIIFNFPTKEHWKNPSKIKWIDDGLEDLMYWCLTLDLKSISMPKLGCGNGGLDWADVKPLIEYWMNLVDFDVYVYI